MRPKSHDSGLEFSNGNGSLIVSSCDQFHITKLTQTKSPNYHNESITMTCKFSTGEQCHIQINTVDLTPKNRLISVPLISVGYLNEH